MKYTAEECEKLEGKEVKFENDIYKQTGIVIGCDPDIGITVVDINDKEDYLVCLPGPSTKDHVFFKHSYKNLFNLYVEMIQEGLLVGERTEKYRKIHSLGGMAECPFT